MTTEEKKKTGKKRKKIMMKIVATNVVASQPPERRPTATPTARANFESQKMLVKFFFDQMKFGLKKVMGPKNL